MEKVVGASAGSRNNRKRVFGRAISIALVILALVLVLGILSLQASVIRWRARYDATKAKLDETTIERDRLRNAYNALKANFSDTELEYWQLYGLPPTYVIYLDGETCVAENTYTKQVEFRDTDAASVIHAAIKALPASGGKILLRSGTYLLSKTITDGGKNFVCLQGEGWNTTLRIADNTQGTVLEVSGRTGWTILDLAIDGNRGGNVQVPGGVPNDMNQNGIHFFRVTHSKIVRVYVHDTVMHGINIHYRSTDNLVADCRVEGCGTPGDYGASSGILVFSNSSRNRVIRCRLADNFARGIYVSAHSNNCTISGNIIVGGRSEAAQGIVVMDSSEGVEVSNNTIFNVPGNGIDVGNKYGPGYKGIAIRGNTIIRAGSCGIWCGSGGSDVVISENYVAGVGSYAICALGPGSRVVDNYIYATENLAILAQGSDLEISGNHIYPP